MKDKQLCHFNGCVNEVRSFTPKNDTAQDNLDCDCGARVCLLNLSHALFAKNFEKITQMPCTRDPSYPGDFVSNSWMIAMRVSAGSPKTNRDIYMLMLNLHTKQLSFSCTKART